MNVRFPMKAWFQFPNFESKDLDFSNPKAAIEYWNSVDKKKLDKMQKKLDSEGEDYCPWGLGLTSTNAIHIHRNGVMSDTFDISLTTVVNEKFLGLINHTQQVEEIKENISSENIPEYITIFFEIESFPEGSTPKVNKQNSMLKYVYLTLNWVIGAAFLLKGLVSVVESFWGGLCLITISLLLLPPSRNFAYSKTNKIIPIKARAVIILALFVAFSVFESAKTRQENIAYFSQNRVKILAQANTALAEKDFEAAVSQTDKYLVSGDEKLLEINTKAKLYLAGDLIDQTLPAGFYGSYSEKRGPPQVTVNRDGTYTKDGHKGEWKIRHRKGDSKSNWVFQLRFEVPANDKHNHENEDFYHGDVTLNYSSSDYHVLWWKEYSPYYQGGVEIIMRKW